MSMRTVDALRREAADRHCDMLHETLRLLLDHGAAVGPDLHQHACQVLAATTREQRDGIGAPRK